MPWAFSLARLKAGNNMAARMAMMAMTTSSSISVNARRVPPRLRPARTPASKSELNGVCITFRSDASARNWAQSSIEPATVAIADIHTSDQWPFMGYHMAVRKGHVDADGRFATTDMAGGFFGGTQSCIIGPGHIDVI